MITISDIGTDDGTYQEHRKLVRMFGPVHIRYQRVSGKPEEWAYFGNDGRQLTEFDCIHPCLTGQLILPDVLAEMEGK
jgi:hypothetical protein